MELQFNRKEQGKTSFLILISDLETQKEEKSGERRNSLSCKRQKVRRPHPKQTKSLTT